MKVIAFHLLNDFSGSPKVLMQLLKGWSSEGIQTELFTGGNQEGFLSKLPGVQTSTFWYRWNANPYIRFVNYFISQFFLVVKSLSKISHEDIVYVNTVLPFGAAIAGKLKRAKVVYHIHETSIKPKLLKSFLFGLAKLLADDVIYVSRYLADKEPITSASTHVMHNALEQSFLNKAKEERLDKIALDNILMVCSLKQYKGVIEFVELAKRHTNLNFKLVVNASLKEIDLFFEAHSIPLNLRIYPVQKNLHPFYQWSDLVVNLSRQDMWVETFGLTIIEGMAYGVPSIVPSVGGIAEIVENEITGFKTDSRDLDTISVCLNELYQRPGLYKRLSINVLDKICQFNEAAFLNQSLQILNIH